MRQNGEGIRKRLWGGGGGDKKSSPAQTPTSQPGSTLMVNKAGDDSNCNTKTPSSPKNFGSGKDVVRIFIIFLAVNNGWKPDWSSWNQSKYYPWFEVLSSGFGFGGSLCVYDYSRTGVGSRLCTDTIEKALYVAEQFKDLYQEYLLYSE